MKSRLMAHALSLLAACVLLLGMTAMSGCGQSAEAKAAGIYDLERASVKTALEKQIEATTDPEEKMGMSMALGFVDMLSITLTLNEDGSASGHFSMMGDSENANGTWKVNGKSITVDLDGDQDAQGTMAGTIDGDTLELSAPSEDIPFKLIFKKRKG